MYPYREVPKKHTPGNVCMSPLESGRMITATDRLKTPITTVKASMPMADGSRKLNFSGSTSDERDNGNSGTLGNGGGQGSGSGSQDNFSGASRRGGDRKNSSSNGVSSLTLRGDQMKREEERIKTFENWPLDFLSPTVMAAAGFYYFRDDVVRCAFCKIEIGKWEKGDIPMKEHKRWSSNCPFVRGVPCGNIPIDGGSSSSHGNQNGEVPEDSDLSYDTCGIHEEMRPFSFCDDEYPSTSAAQKCALPILKARHSSNNHEEELEQSPELPLERLGVRDMRAPVHPEYCSEAARLHSYSTWPVSMKQRPNVLAEAGFYYTGNGDQTICFHCGGGLRDWEDGDDPWIEHAKWFSKCFFVNLVKGCDFVSQVAETRPAVMNAEEVKGLSQASTPATSPEAVSTLVSKPALAESEKNANSSSCATQGAAALSTETMPKEAKEVKDEVRLCKICYAAELGVVFLPCGHMVACVKCATSVTVCPVCRQQFTHTVRAFIP